MTRTGAGRRRAGVLAAGVVAAAVLATGCGADGDRTASGAAAQRADAAAPQQELAAPAPAAPNAPNASAAGKAPNAAGAGAGAATPAAGGAAAGAPPVRPAADGRLIAYTAQLSLRSKDVPKLLEEARGVALTAGGYVGAESASGAPAGTAEGSQSGQIVLKVPSATFQQTLDRLAALGEVASRRTQADDLTQQVADVASRVQTQQASVDRIRALMSQAKNLQEVTSLESELARRESDLESLQKQQKELSARTSLSTITVDARREAPVRHQDGPDAPKDEGFGASVGGALSGGWSVLVAIVRGAAMGVAAAAPFLLVLVPVGLVLRFRRRRGAAKPGPVPAVPPRPADLPRQPDGTPDAAVPAVPAAQEAGQEQAPERVDG